MIALGIEIIFDNQSESLKGVRMTNIENYIQQVEVDNSIIMLPISCIFL